MPSLSQVFADATLRLVLFGLGSLAFVWVSRGALARPRSHGFARFFAFEAILALVLWQLPLWERDPLAPHQLLSWVLLLGSLVLAVHGVRRLVRQGRRDAARDDGALFQFEQTGQLVTTGVFRYIRHPMYAALLYLGWGAFLKDASAVSVALVAVLTGALVVTARRDEAECLAYFGDAYAAYMKTTQRFLPGVY